MGARPVPVTRDLDSEDAWETLRRVHYLPLLRGSMKRFADADGFAYARAVAFQMILAIFPALIFFVAVAVWTRSESLRSAVESVVSSLAPGSTSGFLQQAMQQGQRSGQGNTFAMLIGGAAALISGAMGMSQIQLGAGRMYGQDDDRPAMQRYRLGLILSLGVGVLLAGAFVAVAFGGAIVDAVEGESVWSWLRWPVALTAAAAGMALLYKFAPNRPQPNVSWLAVGGLTATVLWLIFSGALALYLSLSSTFGQTYGPLAGLIGLFVWAELTGIATLAGIAFAAQLEAERTGSSEAPPVQDPDPVGRFSGR